jgi:PASTA domain
MREVTDACLRLRLEPVLVGSGLALEQSPPAGAKLRPGTKVTVSFGTPAQQKAKAGTAARN